MPPGAFVTRPEDEDFSWLTSNWRPGFGLNDHYYPWRGGIASRLFDSQGGAGDAGGAGSGEFSSPEDIDRFFDQWDAEGRSVNVTAPPVQAEGYAGLDFVDRIAGASDPEDRAWKEAEQQRAEDEQRGRDLIQARERDWSRGSVPPHPTVTAPPASAGAPPRPPVAVVGGAPSSAIPAEESMDLVHLTPTLDRSSYGDFTMYQGAPHAGTLPDGSPTTFGPIEAWGNVTPGREDLSGLRAHAFNAGATPPQPPPEPTTVTSARFDPREGLVPLGPPSSATAPVRESYQIDRNLPYDPEAERAQRMRREVEDLQLQGLRRQVTDPYGRERFQAEQRMAEDAAKARISSMSEQERRDSFVRVNTQIDTEANNAIAAIRGSNLPDAEKKNRLALIEQRRNDLKEQQRQAFGIGARITTGELYKPTPAY